MKKAALIFIILLAAVTRTPADCSLDHLGIGCNPDGDPNSIADNKVLFLDCTRKYHNTPDEWERKYYNIPESWYGDYRLSEPGLEMISDGTRTLARQYQIVVECVAISSDLTVLADNLVVMAQVGDVLSVAGDHLHLTYRVPDEAAAGRMQWITIRLRDELEFYESAQECTIVFCQEPGAGDIQVDGKVDLADLAALAVKWLSNDGARINDYHERADINQDGKPDLVDFDVISRHWLKQ